MLSNLKMWIGLLILLGGLTFLVLKNSEKNTVNIPNHLIPEWHQNEVNIDAIDQVVIAQDGEQLSLLLVNGVWHIKDSFLASHEAVVKLFRSLQMAQIIEAKTANPANHAQLGLSEDDLLISFKKDGEVQHALYLGKQLNAGLTFVRHEGEDQSYAVKGLEPISSDSDNWRLKMVLDIDAEALQKVSVTPVEGPEITVDRNSENGTLQLVDIPKDYQLKADAYLEQLFSGLTQLIVDETIPAESWYKLFSDGVKAHQLSPHLKLKYLLKLGQEVNLNLYDMNESFYMKIDSDLYPQYQGWVMKIADYKFKALNRQLSEFIEPVSAVKEVDRVIDEAAVMNADDFLNNLQ